jgi:hypothetical protein
MYQRHAYKAIDQKDLIHHVGPDTVASLKEDGANFWLKVNADGSSSWISRRESVHGGYPDKTDRLPHLASIRFPKEYAGHVINVELIHTGTNPDAKDSHRTVSGILNSLGPRAAATQALIGPVRARMFDVISPEINTYGEKLEYMKKLEAAIGKPEILSTIKTYQPHEIDDLLRRTKDRNQEGIILTSLTKPESDNPRLKVKHRLIHSLKISRILQEEDIHGNLKPSMGAVEVVDASGRAVANVGSGWTREQRIEAWNHPSKYLGRVVDVESMGIAASRLRAPVYHGDSDGNVDSIDDYSPFGPGLA